MHVFAVTNGTRIHSLWAEEADANQERDRLHRRPSFVARYKVVRLIVNPKKES